MRPNKTIENVNSSSKINTLTTGNLKRHLLLFALPIFVGSLLQQLYNVIDVIVAGRMINSSALSAIGVAIPIYFLLISVIMGIGMGVMILLSQLFGAGELEQIKRVFSTMTIFFTVISVLLGVIGAVFAEPMLRMIKTPDEILNQGTLYLQILLLGVPFTMLYNMVGATMRSLGDTKNPLYALLLASCINLALNCLFVLMGFGIAGIALATIIAQAVSGIYLWKVMRREFPILALNRSDYTFDRKLLMNALKVCLPMVIQQSAIFFSLIVMQSIINLFGNEQIAGMTAATRIEAFILLPVQTLGSAVSIFAGQNIGAGQMERLKKGMRFSILVSLILVTGLATCTLFFWGNIVGFIVGTDVGAAASGNLYFSICAWSYPLTAIMYSLSGVLMGAGDTAIAAIYSTTSIFTQLLVAFILVPSIGFLAVPISSCVGRGAAVIIICARYFKGTWKSKALVHTQERQEIPLANQD